MRKVLVTGGAGFIGSHTVDRLLARGIAVRVLDSLAPPVHPDGRKPAYLSNEAEFLRGDVRRREDLLRAMRGVDAVIHLAAHQDYLTDFSTFFDVNTVGTALLYELIVREGLPIQKVVVASSQSVYGEGKYACEVDGGVFPPPRTLEQMTRREWNPACPHCGGTLRPVPTDEETTNPHNQYAISKYTQEMIALTLGRRHGIPSVAMRYSITQGPRQSFTNAYSGILRIFTLRLLSDRPTVAYEDGEQLRDYVSVDDVVAANLLVLERPEADYQAFNVGGARPLTVLQYGELLARQLGKDFPVQISGEFRLGDTRHIISDSSRLRALGWEPKVQIEEIAARYVAWAREQPGARDHSPDAERIMRAAGVLRGSMSELRSDRTL